MKDNAIGALIPMQATRPERNRLARNAVTEVESPPTMLISRSTEGLDDQIPTFIHDQNQSKIAQLYHCLLPGCGEPACPGGTPSHADEDLPDQSAVDGVVQRMIDHVEQENKRR
nr:hypothetical protein CFP56_00376 [Quercus suber]